MGFRKCFEQACEAPCRLTHGRASVSLGISRHASRKQILAEKQINPNPAPPPPPPPMGPNHGPFSRNLWMPFGPINIEQSYKSFAKLTYIASKEIYFL